MTTAKPHLNMYETNVCRPFLKWAGGKRQLLAQLYPHVPKEFGHYYEPFLGGGALFFGLRASGWIGMASLSDSNKRLVSTYTGVRDDVQGVIDILTPKRYELQEFLEERKRLVDSFVNDTEVAAWMIYLNRTCFNGLYRVNKNGQFNVPFGRYTNPTICDEFLLQTASRALRKTMIGHVDFERCVRSAEKGDLVYFDPPYAPVSDTANFTAYTAAGFLPADHARLAATARKLKARGVHVILSNADVPAVREWYHDFQLREVQGRRSINSKGGKRGAVGELIIT